MRRQHPILRWCIAAALLCACGCRELPVDSNNTGNGKRIAIESRAVFAGDPSAIPGYETFIRSRERDCPPAGRARAKRHADIDFARAAVFVVNSFAADQYLESIDWDPCVINRSKHEAFAGRDLETWDGIVAGMRGYIEGDVIYSGDLKRNGGAVTGDILVAPGFNCVYAGFLDASGDLLWVSGGTYVLHPDVIDNVVAEEGLEEGWLEQWYYDEQQATFVTGIWQNRQHAEQEFIGGDGFTTVLAYNLPMIGAIGVSEEFSQSFCEQETPQQLIDYTGPHGMVLVHSAGQTLQLLGSNPVSFTYDFWIDTTELTQGRYQAIAGTNPAGHTGDPELPVENVSWFDAVRYCMAKSFLEDYQQCYDTLGAVWTCDVTQNGYRLPTESEWEFAYRAGTTTTYYWGNTIDGAYAWYGDNSQTQTHPVAQKLPNAYGLYDMAGNVWEWCNDWCCAVPPADDVDWTGPATGTTRMLRGGQYDNFGPGEACLSATFRYQEAPASAAPYSGFRCVRTAPH
ncbi:MAG: SUMF1/EgtB/PvdO family nonheme iron enzyme [Chitinivibrionales bacterium]|nr:SUMF1/EgtB/PvdO family nonheme iron enzyme [Chitinivibrionales bacterium]MBD3396916.1 SUMF1/EgtB/PvdO family nonheme iron enzyme [Chitinivibrionales bacterium]